VNPDLPKFEDCSGCGVCSNVCAASAIRIVTDKNGFLQPVVDGSKCVKCGACEKKCPCLSADNLPNNDISEAVPWAAWSNDGRIRYNSSSGGVFAQIATELLQSNNTVVAGASLQINNAVRHIAIDNADDIVKLQGTKYIQSETGDRYKKTKDCLEKGYSVLFSGTPCQIAGLYTYIGNKIYKGILYTAEVICHGVPSKLLLQYALEQHNAKEVVTYRTKSKGWGYVSQRMSYLKENGIYEINERKNDWFYRLFLSDLFLRPLCYDCPYGKLPRTADISLADFWGIKSFPEEQYSGISLLIVNNEKGRQLVNNTVQLTKHRVDWDTCLPYNRHVFFSKKELRNKYLSTETHKIVKLPPGLNRWLFFSSKKNPFLWIYLRKAKISMNKRKNTILKSVLNTVNGK
jgi:coenzyme F420-reducing hydrogenase beta subunit